MIKGEVSATREAVIRVCLVGPDGTETDMEGVIDTGFTDYLTVPPELLPVISWCFDEFVEVILADGSVSTVEAHKVTVLWDGAEREVAAFAMRGGPLVGMSMLQGSRVTLDVVDGGAVSIDVLK